MTIDLTLTPAACICAEDDGAIVRPARGMTAADRARLPEDETLNAPVRQYYRLLKDFMARLGANGVLHWGDSFLPVGMGM